MKSSFLKKSIAMIFSICIVLVMNACTENEVINDDSLESSILDTHKIEKVEPTYENPSRPVKDFWIRRDNLLVLTESGELLYGEPNTSNPYFITAGVKDVKLDDGGEGLILLENNKVIKVNDRYKKSGHISFYTLSKENPNCDIEGSTYDVQAKELFNHYLYISIDGKLKDLCNNIITEKPIKTAYILNYSTNHGLRYSGVFLYDDGTVEHRFLRSESEGLKIRNITTNAVQLNFVASTFNNDTGYCSVIRDNGELLCWNVDEYDSNDSPLNAINKVANDAKSTGNSSVYYDGDNVVLYLNDKDVLVQYLINENEYKNLMGNVEEAFMNYYLDFDYLGGINTKQGTLALTFSGDLFEIGSDEPLIQNVKEVIGDGRYINFKDNKCARLNSVNSYVYRTDNVKKAKNKYAAGSGDVLQVFLKYGGSLYAADGMNATIYKTVFSEKEVSLSLNGNHIQLKRALQSKNEDYMLPYDELCEILGLTGIIDRSANGIDIESGNIKLTLCIDQNKYKVNNENKTLKSAPYEDSEGKIWIPIKIVAETFGYKYEYNATSSSINLNK